MEGLQNIVYAFAAKPWHLILFAIAGFIAFFWMGRRRDFPKQ